MKEKIKNLFAFMGRAWRASNRGKLGVVMAIVAVIVILRMFWGAASVQHFVAGAFHLHDETAGLSAETAKLADVNMRIRLIQEHSPDYIEELAETRLNLGDPKLKILKY